MLTRILTYIPRQNCRSFRLMEIRLKITDVKEFVQFKSLIESYVFVGSRRLNVMKI